ncbi:MAG: sigma-54-dependent Fis family transcriptional regulator [Desulfobacterales bacterium]|nr:sigma-54-dependent Fis family transcriptional regulator [Desulfobacterales bacterium]
MAKVLIIDDDKMICDMLSRMVGRMGHDAAYTLTLTHGMKEVSSGTFDVVFLDVCMPDGNGLEVLPKIREASSSPEVIIITGEGDPDGAELAIKSGAWDYVEKPLSIHEMTLSLVRSLQYREEKGTGKPRVALKREGIVGSSQQMRACFDLLAQAASSDVSVLITGETGTGKELFAQAIHDNSRRADKNFVVVDCAALPGNLVESMLFGHEKGAFTGADKAHVGLVKQADGGTLFLDEVGELPLSVQKAFLRVLQERRFRPLGDKQEIESDFRLVAATNRNLDQMVEAGKFRDDLLFRLRSFTMELPHLRERRGDIREIAMHYMARLCDRHATGTKGLSPEFLETLISYGWPGNVRELVNTMEKVLATSGDDPILFPKHLPTNIRVKVARDSVSKEPPAKSIPKPHEPVKALASLRDFRMAAASEAEKEYLQNLLSLTEDNIKEACRISRLSRSRLYELLKKHKISIPG